MAGFEALQDPVTDPALDSDEPTLEQTNTTRDAAASGDDASLEAEAAQAQRLQDLLALIYGQSVEDCLCPITGRKKNDAAWLDLFAYQACPDESGNGIAELVLSLPCGNVCLDDIHVSGKSVEGTLNLDANSEESRQAAYDKVFAMALLAKSCKVMREQGVVVNAKDKYEATILVLAAEIAGLKVAGAPDIDPEFKAAIAAEMSAEWTAFLEKSGIETAPAITTGFEAAEDAAEDDSPAQEQEAQEQALIDIVEDSEHISDTFNLESLPENIAQRLDALDISQDDYKELRRFVIENGTAKRQTLLDSFEDVSKHNIGEMLKTLDKEGITENVPGKGRKVLVSAPGGAATP